MGLVTLRCSSQQANGDRFVVCIGEKLAVPDFGVRRKRPFADRVILRIGDIFHAERLDLGCQFLFCQRSVLRIVIMHPLFKGFFGVTAPQISCQFFCLALADGGAVAGIVIGK